MDITPIITAVIGLLGAVVTATVVPFIKSKTTENELKIISFAAKTAVFAAQQLLEDNLTKKAYAIDYTGELLAKKNIKLSIDEISAAVEAALKEIKTGLGEEKW